jgi:cytochrome c553
MKRVVRWLGIGLAGLAGLAVLATVAIYIISGQVLGQRTAAQAETLPAPSAALLADAPRQGKLRGCVSCHGEGLGGKLVVEIPNVVRLFAPNLTQIAARATDQQLAAAIRQGIGHDGRPLFMMPSQQYARLSDEEVAALVRWIRSLPRVPGGEEHVTVGPLGRAAIAAGQLKPVTEEMELFRSQAPIDLGPRHAAARQFVAATCADCHGPALLGRPTPEGSVAPDLSIAGAYSYDQFRSLMQAGKSPSGKDLGLMKKVAEEDFRHLREEEMRSIYDYLQARAQKLSS